LFLVALPETVTAPLLVFIGCYQIPMYLTPLVTGRFLKGQST
jgi:ACR3 family arsenite transporter